MLLEILKYLGILMAAGSGAFLATALVLATRGDQQHARFGHHGRRPRSPITLHNRQPADGVPMSRLSIEAGAVSFRVDAPLTVLRVAAEAEPIPADEVVTLDAGDALLVPARAAGEIRTGDSERARVRVANVTSLEQWAPGASKAAASRG